MKSLRSQGWVTILILLVSAPIFAQETPSFDVAAYKQFLSSHQNMTSGQLMSLYSAGAFTSQAPTNFSSAKYFDSINTRYTLTADEKLLLGKNGFVVTERLPVYSYGNAFLEVYDYDLPVFVSTDAILHALHMSWDAILMTTESQLLSKKLDTLLSKMHNQLPTAAARYSSLPAMKQMVDDIDIYLTVPRILLGDPISTKYPENAQAVQDLLNFIKAETPASYPLFSNDDRQIDFSQFTVRGHYTQSPTLSKYFQAMMWLGRTEIYLIAPTSADNTQVPADIQRQIVDAALLKEIADDANAFPLLEEIDGILRSFIGVSDNVTLSNISDVLATAGITNIAELLDTTTCKIFQQTLGQESYAFQRINSQLLTSDPMSPDQAEPASSFLLLGQRFIIDSYTTGNVVYDRIVYNNTKVTRMLPSAQDVLFAIGNNASAQLLKPDLDQYNYSSNLTALRYLIDSYEPAFWQGTIYNGWLNSIRSLNPPMEKTGLPAFMQTAAWWQEKMNTQLASWAELRHDFILYAKQSYTFGTTCSFPESYVEPIPQFFDAVKAFAETGITIFQNQPIQDIGTASYFTNMRDVADTLGGIARKELNGTALTDREKIFLKTMLYTQPQGCGFTLSGWYPHLFYTSAGVTANDMVIADIHTAPTDAAGNPVGWVLHVGTGPLNMAVVVTQLPDGTNSSFIGPVSSYYEHLATNFKRLTDEEWAKMYNVAPSLRPSFINLYMADSTGSTMPEGQSLIMGVEQQPAPTVLPTTLMLNKNFPNPFNSSTIITFTIPEGLRNAKTDLSVYDVQGRLVKRLLSQNMPAGNFATRWDGTTEGGITAASGVYFYHLIVGNQRQIGKMNFVK